MKCRDWMAWLYIWSMKSFASSISKCLWWESDEQSAVIQIQSRALWHRHKVLLSRSVIWLLISAGLAHVWSSEAGSEFAHCALKTEHFKCGCEEMKASKAICKRCSGQIPSNYISRFLLSSHFIYKVCEIRLMDEHVFLFAFHSLDHAL